MFPGVCYCKQWPWGEKNSYCCVSSEAVLPIFVLSISVQTSLLKKGGKKLKKANTELSSTPCVTWLHEVSGSLEEEGREVTPQKAGDLCWQISATVSPCRLLWVASPPQPSRPGTHHLPALYSGHIIDRKMLGADP